MISLPCRLEATLSWAAALGCLSLTGYHYWIGQLLRPWLRERTRALLSSSPSCGSTSLTDIPLTVCSHYEKNRLSVEDRWSQFVLLLGLLSRSSSSGNLLVEKQEETAYGTHVLPVFTGLATNGHKAEEERKEVDEEDHYSDTLLVSLIREHLTLRRLASLAMRVSDRSSPLREQLRRVWPQLLTFPSLPEISDFSISLILPCYRDDGLRIRQLLEWTRDMCAHPGSVQVVVVDAGSCMHMNEETVFDEACKAGWGDFRLVTYRGNAGRGPAQNFGASHASGAIFTFLHSDTKLPVEWDLQIVSTFYPSSSSLSSSVNHKETRNHDSSATSRSSRTSTTVSACAFRFGVDGEDGKLPPGIRAVEVAVNLRCAMWKLAYGDQCFSIPKTTFEYMGGLPHQCFMEDYELVSWFRKREAFGAHTMSGEWENFKILNGAPARCSPRRWQRHGVLNVTYMNARLISMYNCQNKSPQEIYEKYYGTRDIVGVTSPWELHVEDLLKDR